MPLLEALGVREGARVLQVGEPASGLYDGALYASAFGISALEEDATARDLGQLREVLAALKPGAPMVLTAPNAIARMRSSTAGDFDPALMAEVFDEEIDGRGSRVKERLYVPTELVELVKRAGFTEVAIRGTVGLDDEEIVIVARRPRA